MRIACPAAARDRPSDLCKHTALLSCSKALVVLQKLSSDAKILTRHTTRTHQVQRILQLGIGEQVLQT